MRDFRRLNAEIRLLQSCFGEKRVYWDRKGRWVMIKDWTLPPGLNMEKSHVVVLIPENYGNGAPLRDAFVNPDLKAREPKTGEYRDIPHYFARFPYARLVLGTKEDWQQAHWQYVCLHETHTGSRANILNYLSHLYAFLSEPFRDWARTFALYGGGR